MNPLAGHIWVYVVLAYILVSLSMWIIARFSPLEWYLMKQPSLDESLCRDHHFKVSSTASRPVAETPTTFVLKNQTCHGHDNRCPHLSVPVLSMANGTQEDFSNSEKFQGSDESDFNKHRQLSPRQEQQMVDIKCCNEFQSYNEDCPCLGQESYSCRKPVLRSPPIEDDSEVPQDDPLDLLKNTPAFGASGEPMVRNKYLHNFLGQQQPQESVLQHSHNETELLSSTNDFTLSNSFWFMIGTLMQQGSDLNPKVKR